MANKDLKGNSKTAFTQLGASNHSLLEREQHDFYATDPKCAIDLINFLPELNNIWECACGQGHLARIFENMHRLAIATDLVDRGYGNRFLNFLDIDTLTLPKFFVDDLNLPIGKINGEQWVGDIVTNPPYSLAEDFLLKAMDLLKEDRYYCAFLKLTWLEGKKRREIFKKYPPKYVLVYSERQNCAKNGEFSKYSSNAIAYCWYIWQKGHTGETTIKWI